jgi:cell division septum initiation protein DivIVA
MDPVTLISVASTAYSALKKGIAMGKELQDMGSQLSQWAGALSDLDFLEKKAKDPPLWKSFSGSAQQEAVEIFAAKRKAQAMRDELRQFIQYSYGQSAWDELVSIEARVRKDRAAHAHRQAELKEAILTWTLGILLFLSGVGMLVFFAWLVYAYK